MALSRLFDFSPNTTINSADVDAEFNQLVNLLAGTSSNVDTTLVLSSATLPPLTLNQTSTGPIQRWQVAGVTKIEVSNSGQFVFEGATADAFETTFAITDPTADRTITFPDAGGTLFLLGGTDLTVADGGTGVSTLTDGGILLGSGTGAITATAVLANGELLIGDNSTDPTVATLTGTANEITVTNGAGSITLAIPDAVTLVTLTLTNDLTVANGGTGASTFTDGGILLGSGTGAITATAVLANGELLIGDNSTDPTVGTLTGTANEITVTNGAGTITLAIPDAVTLVTLTLTNDLIVAHGGTGVSTLTDGGVLLGSGTGAITPLGQATNGQLVVGSTSADPALATLTGTANEITVTNGAGSITLAIPDAVILVTPTITGTMSIGSDIGGRFNIDGTADEIQLLVQAHSTQTASLVTFENSAGTDMFTVSNAGNTVIAGSLSVTGVIDFTDATITLGGIPYEWPGDDGTASQFLQSDGAGALTWATPAGTGNVSNTGTPLNNQLAIWTTATVVEGDANLTWNGSALTVTGTGRITGNTEANGTLLVGANGTTVDAKAHILSPGTTTIAQVLEMPSSNTVRAMEFHYAGTRHIGIEIQAAKTRFDLDSQNFGDDKQGTQFFAGRNSSAGTVGPSAGCFSMAQAGGTSYEIWTDATGDLRIHSACPTGSTGSPTVSDTAGAVVGDQTSWHYKKDYVPTALTALEALERIKALGIYDFAYKDDPSKIPYTGLVGFNRDDWYLTNTDVQQTPVLDTRTIIGHLVFAVQALAAQIGA